MSRSVKIKVEHVSKTFIVKGGMKIHALDDFNFDIYEKEFLAIVGPSGCGKSTLLSIIAGLLKPTEGYIYHDEEKITGPDQKRGVVFQRDAVFPWLTVRKNIEYGPLQRNPTAKNAKEIASRYLKIVGLEKYENLWPKQLSGGMRKRVDLARALANDPEVLLMDEPFGSLDVMTKQNLQVEVSNLVIKFKKTVFFVTHDLEEAIFLADRVVVVSEQPGRIKAIVQIGFERPRLPSIRTTVEFQKLRGKLGAFIDKNITQEGGKII